MAYDLLIKNARIVDGTGAPSVHGAIGITDGRIVSVGAADGQANRVIDADGLVVAPGFVDIHTHYDAQVTWDALCTPSCFHGVTSVVMGNCGYAMSPVRPEDRDYVMGTFSCVEGVSKATLVNGMPWEWETQAEYLAWLERRGLGINVAPLVGHSAVRRYVLGAAAHERAATSEEVEAMARLVRQGMVDGAVGFSTSRVAHQKGEFGEPIPSFVAEESEIFRLADVLRELDRGIIGINPRTKALDFVQEDKDQLFRLAKATGRMLSWNEFNHRWDKPQQWSELLEYMENAQRHGAQVYAVMRCQRMDLHFNLREGSRAFDALPAWKDLLAQGHEEKLNRLRNENARAALAAELGPAMKPQAPAQGGSMFGPRLQQTAVAVAATDAYKDIQGRLLVDVAQERGMDPAVLLLDIARDEQLATELVFQGVTNGDDAAVERMLKSPATITGISDGGAHLHSMTGTDYPTYFLARWVRERGAFTLEEGVKMLTSVPAGLVGLADRGRIAPGMAADLCIFDPDRVRPLDLEIWHDLPGGEVRHVKRAEGMEWVIVNGEPLLHKGEASSAMPGRVLRG